MSQGVGLQVEGGGSQADQIRIRVPSPHRVGVTRVEIRSMAAIRAVSSARVRRASLSPASSAS